METNEQGLLSPASVPLGHLSVYPYSDIYNEDLRELNSICKTLYYMKTNMQKYVLFLFHAFVLLTFFFAT